MGNEGRGITLPWADQALDRCKALLTRLRLQFLQNRQARVPPSADDVACLTLRHDERLLQAVRPNGLLDAVVLGVHGTPGIAFVDSDLFEAQLRQSRRRASSRIIHRGLPRRRRALSTCTLSARGV